MSTINELIAESKMNVKDLAVKAKISESSLRKLRTGKPVKPIVVGKVCEALSELLKRDIKPSQIDGISML
jgi:DNA-binding Xre family transcriptional regulator